MFKKTLALVLCALMAMGTLAACGDDAAAPYVPVIDQSGSQSGTQAADAEVTVAPTEEIPVTEPTEIVETGMGNPGTVLGSGVTFISTLRVHVSDENENGVVYYGENEKYGVMSGDGSYDTGAIYDNATCEGAYFKVRTEEIGTPDELDKINSVGLVDCTGEELIPAQYAVVEDLSDRFYRVCAVTERTEADEYLVYLSKGAFTVSAGEKDPRYLGTWSVYDLQTGAEVPNATGTKGGSVTVRGDVIVFTADDGNRRYINAAGQDLPTEATYHNNGTYTDYSDDAVYDSNGNKVFDGVTDGYEVSNWDSGYYRAHKYENGTTNYVLLDETGAICSGTFPKTPYVEEGNLVSCDDKLYDMQGNCLFEESLYGVYYYDGYWLIRDDAKNVYLMDSNYTVEKICQIDEDYTYSLSGSDFAVTCRADGEYTYYSVLQKEFVDGEVIAKGIAQRKTGESRDLINAMTEEVLLTGYRAYYAIETEEGICIYAYAGNDVYDVFRIAA